MADDGPNDMFLDEEQITSENLRKIFETVGAKIGLSVTVDGDGNVILKGSYRFACNPMPDSFWIRMNTGFITATEATLGEKLLYINEVNSNLLIQARVTNGGEIGFNFFLPIAGGVTLVNLTTAAMEFDRFLGMAFDMDERGVLA